MEEKMKMHSKPITLTVVHRHRFHVQWGIITSILGALHIQIKWFRKSVTVLTTSTFLEFDHLITWDHKDDFGLRWLDWLNFLAI